MKNRLKKEKITQIPNTRIIRVQSTNKMSWCRSIDNISNNKLELGLYWLYKKPHARRVLMYTATYSWCWTVHTCIELGPSLNSCFCCQLYSRRQCNNSLRMSQRFFEGTKHATLYAKFRINPPQKLVDRIVSYVKEKVIEISKWIYTKMIFF